MIKIYDGEVLNIDINAYNRYEILKKGCEMTGIDKMNYLLYDNDKIIGSASYLNILNDDSFSHKVFKLRKDSLFKDARDYFKSYNRREGDCVPVLDEKGTYCFLLVFYENRSFDLLKAGKLVNDYWELDFKKDEKYLDFSLIQECDNILFWELEEYTYEITCLVKYKFPQKRVAFLDENAKVFFDNVYIFDTVYDTKKYTGKWMFISSERKSLWTMPIITDYVALYFNSLKVIYSLVWCKKISSYGEENPEKIIYMIDGSCGKAGLVDIMKFVCAHIVLANKRGWIPYVRLNKFPNQYLQKEDDNMWEYYFENVSDLTMEEIERSKNVISLANNNIEMISADNPYITEIVEWMMECTYSSIKVRKRISNSNCFINTVKLNKRLKEEIVNSIPFILKEESVLGVIARGSDYAISKGRRDEVKLWTAPLDDLIKRIKEIMKYRKYKYCFVATEDEKIFKRLHEELEDSMLYIDQDRVTFEENTGTEIRVSDLWKEKNINMDILSHKYIATLYALSICESLLSNTACGATFIAKNWNNGRYKYDEIVG